MRKIRLMLPAGARLPLHPREIRHLLLRMLQTLAPKNTDLELVFVRDAEMVTLNRHYAALQGPTNCLAFPRERDTKTPAEGLETFGGSLCISLDTLHRECLLYGQASTTHLRRLLAHGLAHLAGFEHGEEMDTVCAMLETLCGADCR